MRNFFLTILSVIIISGCFSSFIPADSEPGARMSFSGSKIIPADSVLLSTSTIKVIKGKSYTIQSIILPDKSTDTVTWTSSNSEVAAVSQKGVVTGVNIGKAIITAATDSGKMQTCKVSVIKDYTLKSNFRYSWGFKKNTMHTLPVNYTKFDLNKYNAFYADTKTQEKVIFLTFDCGYENGYGKSILDTLSANNVKATFFVLNSYIEKNPKLVAQMKKEGHMVGSHTITHKDMTKMSVEQIENELAAVEATCLKLTKYPLDKCFRSPEGVYSKRALQILKKNGYYTFFWSMAYVDWDVDKQPGKNYVLNQFKKYHHNGAVVLMHIISKSNAEALDDVIKFLKKEGYRFALVDEFMQ